MNQLEFCAIECDRQGTDKKVEMAIALAWAKRVSRDGLPPTKLDILILGQKVEPTVNHSGFRKTPVSFANGSLAVDWNHVPRLIDQLLQHWTDISPQEVFQEFERIHPFADGNGRVGQILFNWRNSTLHDPEFASEYIP